jgi:hypothetical protein
VEKLNKVTLQVMTKSLGLTKEEQLQKVTELVRDAVLGLCLLRILAIKHTSNIILERRALSVI